MRSLRPWALGCVCRALVFYTLTHVLLTPLPPIISRTNFALPGAHGANGVGGLSDGQNHNFAERINPNNTTQTRVCAWQTMPWQSWMFLVQSALSVQMFLAHPAPMRTRAGEVFPTNLPITKVNPRARCSGVGEIKR